MAYVQQSQTQRTVVLGTIVGLHVLLGIALATGLARKVVEVVAAPLQTDLIEEIQQEDKPPPPPPPEMERPPVEVPPPEVSIDLPMETAQTTAITNVTDRPVPVAPPPPPAAVARTNPKLDPRRSPPTDDFYPASARRAEIEGVTTIRACVSPEGRTSGEPSIGNSSGNASLDEAAVRWAKRARWAPGTEDGKPVETCASFNVRFKLTE
jgi:periplasmic protein TonB